MSYYAVGLVVPAGKVLSTLTNFVTRLDLSHAPAAWWAQVAAAGADIRVKQGGVDCPIDLVTINVGASTGYLYFRATLTTSANVFTLECGTGAAAPAVTDPIGRNAVWQDYESVIDPWSLADRTGKHTNFTLTDATTIHDGIMDFGGGGGGGAGRCVSPTVTTFTSWTMSHQTTRVDTSQRTTMNYDGSSTVAKMMYRGGISWQAWCDSDTFLSTGQTSTTLRFALTHATTVERKVYTLGVLRATDATVNQRPTGTAQVVFGGNGQTVAGSEDYNGTLVHAAYLRGSVLTADWLAAEYESWESPATFYTMVAAAWASGSLTLGATGTAEAGALAATGSGSLTLGGAGVVAAPLAGSGSLTLGGAGGTVAAITGSGSLTLGAFGEASAFHYDAPDIQCCEPAMTRRRAA